MVNTRASTPCSSRKKPFPRALNGHPSIRPTNRDDQQGCSPRPKARAYNGQVPHASRQQQHADSQAPIQDVLIIGGVNGAAIFRELADASLRAQLAAPEDFARTRGV